MDLESTVSSWDVYAITPVSRLRPCLPVGVPSFLSNVILVLPFPSPLNLDSMSIPIVL